MERYGRLARPASARRDIVAIAVANRSASSIDLAAFQPARSMPTFSDPPWPQGRPGESAILRPSRGTARVQGHDCSAWWSPTIPWSARARERARLRPPRSPTIRPELLARLIFGTTARRRAFVARPHLATTSTCRCASLEETENPRSRRKRLSDAKLARQFRLLRFRPSMTRSRPNTVGARFGCARSAAKGRSPGSIARRYLRRRRATRR